jgi:CRP/FNR family transcriptional regulator, cyclic AMP receptor protein
MHKHVDGVIDDLATVELFSTCTRRELRTIAALCTPMTVHPGFVLTTQGGTGLECFVVQSGRASVTVDGEEIASVGAGECVGEMALLDGGRRSATVTSETTMEIYVLTRAEFRQMLDGNGDIRRKIAASMASRLRTAQQA